MFKIYDFIYLFVVVFLFLLTYFCSLYCNKTNVSALLNGKRQCLKKIDDVTCRFELFKNTCNTLFTPRPNECYKLCNKFLTSKYKFQMLYQLLWILKRCSPISMLLWKKYGNYNFCKNSWCGNYRLFLRFRRSRVQFKSTVQQCCKSTLCHINTMIASHIC